MKKSSFTILFILTLFLLTQSCAINPVTGKRELMLISEDEEIAMGKQSDVEIRAVYGIYADPDLNQYVQNIGNTMVPYSHRPKLVYHFAVLDSPVVNAFAAPGGYIYVTRGILAMMNSEAELAVVLAHEMGHVNARHSVSRLSNMMLMQVGLAAGSAISKTFADIAGIAGVGAQLLFLQYSRDDEREADELGVEYSRKGQYNPEKMIAFFSTLEKLGDLSGGQPIPGFLSTHPLTSERIQNTQEMILPGDASLKVKQNEYFKRIQGTVYGDDPRQGFTEGDTFYHPDMRFKFSFPLNWKLQNTPARVVIISEDENAAVILQAEKSSENPREFARQTAAQQQDLRLLDERSISIHGMPAHQQLYHAEQQDQSDLRLLVTYISYRGFMFIFVGMSTVDAFSSYQRSFNLVSGSFNQLRDSHYLNRQPKRLALVNANGRQTLKTIFQRQGLPEKLWQNFAIMNAMELDQTPKSGKLIKVIK